MFNFLRNIAELAVDQGDGAKARAVLKRLLASQERMFEPDDTRIAVTLEIYARFERKEGRIYEAEKLEARAKAIRERASAKPGDPSRSKNGR